MRRTLLPLCVTASLLLAGTNARAQDAPRWTAPAVRITHADTAMAFTMAGRSLTVLFNGFIADAQGQADLAPVTRTATFSARLEEVQSGSRVSFIQHLRGGVVKDADARIVIVLVLPDRTETVVFPYGKSVGPGELYREFRSSLHPRRAQEYAVSIFVRIDRRTPEATARVDIDSFDVRVFQ